MIKKIMMICVTETRQHSGVDCRCLLKSKYDQVKPENTVKSRTRITEIFRQNTILTKINSNLHENTILIQI